MEVVSIHDEATHEPADGVHLSLLAGGESMNVQHFTIEAGASVPAHSHPHDQAGFIYNGTLVFEVGGEEIVVGPGDSYFIPGDEEHAAENPGETPVDGVDIFSPPRESIPGMDE